MSSAYSNLVDTERDDATYTIHCKMIDGNAYDFELKGSKTVGDLKQAINAKLSHDVKRQRLINKGRELRTDTEKLCQAFSNEPGTELTLHLVLRPVGVRGGSSAAPRGNAARSNAARGMGARGMGARAGPSRARQYIQRGPRQTVQCPFCRVVVQFAAGSRMIQCSSCGGISRIQAPQNVPQNLQKSCPGAGCTTVLAYQRRDAFVRCPRCNSTIETARWRVVKTEAKAAPEPAGPPASDVDSKTERKI